MLTYEMLRENRGERGELCLEALVTGSGDSGAGFRRALPRRARNKIADTGSNLINTSQESYRVRDVNRALGFFRQSFYETQQEEGQTRVGLGEKRNHEICSPDFQDVRHSAGMLEGLSRECLSKGELVVFTTLANPKVYKT